MNYNHDLDEEELKLKVCIRKEIDYEKMNMGGDNEIKMQKLSVNNRQRMDLVKSLILNNSNLIKSLKLHSQILSNWISYVGYLSKEEFISAMTSIGVNIEQ